MKRIVIRLVGLYLAVALVGRLMERMGVARCGCSADCWCQRPGLSAFRWAFPWAHR